MTRTHLTAITTTVLLFAIASCGAARQDAAATSTTTSTLEAQIVADMQGSQLDVWGGGEPAPGGTTTMFVHRGQRAAEVYWTTDGWCVARLFTWTVEHVASPTRFDVHYEAVRHFDDCVASSSDDLLLEVYDVVSAPAATTVLGSYPALDATWTERTVCSSRWDASSPCGLPAAAAAADRWL